LEPMRAWMHAGFPHKLCFFFLSGVLIVTVVRTVGLTLHGEGRRQLARPLAASTYGLAQAGLWFTAAAAALGVISAGEIFGNSTRSGLAIMAEGSLDVFDLTAVGLGLCAVNVTSAWGLDAYAAGRPRVWRLARHAIGVIPILLLAAALIEIRRTYVAELSGRDDRWVGAAVERAVGMFLSRMTWLFSGCGLMTWLCVLADRRRVESWELGVGS
jgi:hypothetical protein